MAATQRRQTHGPIGQPPADKWQAWLVIAAFAVVEFTIWGATLGTTGVFIAPLIKAFGWDREQVSGIATAFALLFGPSCFVTGWLTERTHPRWLVAAGCVIGGAAYLAASRVNSLPALLVCYALTGICVALTTDTVLMVVAVDWFGERSALAIGIGATGRSVGLATAPSLATWVVTQYGWRTGMVGAALPMLLIGLPVSLLFIRPRPGSAQTARRSVHRRQAEAELPGLSLSAALWTLPLWLILLANVAFAMGTSGIVIHMIPYLIAIAYTPQMAALIFGIQAAFAGLGHVVIGWLADRYGAKRMVVISFALIALAVMALVGAASPKIGIAAVIAFIPLWGFNFGSDTLLSVVLVQVLGRRRYGTLTGLLNLTGSFGHSIGPIFIGAVFDMSGSYAPAFELCALITLCAAVAGAFVFPAKGHDEVAAAPSGVAL